MKKLDAEEELKELARMGRRMLQLQRHYFRSGKCPDALAAAKKAEREFDERCRDVIEFRTPALPFDAEAIPT